MAQDAGERAEGSSSLLRTLREAHLELGQQIARLETVTFPGIQLARLPIVSAFGDPCLSARSSLQSARSHHTADSIVLPRDTQRQRGRTAISFSTPPVAAASPPLQGESWEFPLTRREKRHRVTLLWEREAAALSTQLKLERDLLLEQDKDSEHPSESELQEGELFSDQDSFQGWSQRLVKLHEKATVLFPPRDQETQQAHRGCFAVETCHRCGKQPGLVLGLRGLGFRQRRHDQRCEIRQSMYSSSSLRLALSLVAADAAAPGGHLPSPTCSA